MIIYAKNLKGDTFTIKAEIEDKILFLNEQLLQQTHIPIEQQRLTWKNT